MVTLELKTGYEAMDAQEVGRAEQLKPLEVELRTAEGVVEDVVTELEHMMQRERDLRDTNGAATSHPPPLDRGLALAPSDTHAPARRTQSQRTTGSSGSQSAPWRS
jgi:hypothetical protein